MLPVDVPFILINVFSGYLVLFSIYLLFIDLQPWGPSI